ncbi:MAG: ribonuclease P protein component [Bacteroidales bacterium]|nr:ribonuclease P protein component [Bacteroidales bacterium]
MPADIDCNNEHKSAAPRLKLGRASMLKHKTEIDNLFRKGKRFRTQCINIVYRKYAQKDLGENVRIFVSAPKKHLRHAVDRNLTKRRMREAIRKNLNALRQATEETSTRLDIGFVFNSDNIIDYSDIEQIIVLSLQKILNDNYE